MVIQKRPVLITGGHTLTNYQKKVYFMCDVLLPTLVNCEDAAVQEVMTKDRILRSKYEGKRLNSYRYLRSILRY